MNRTISSVTLQAGAWGVVGKRGLKASASFNTLWTPPVGGDVSLESSRSSQTVHASATCDKHNASVTAAFRNVAEVRLNGAVSGNDKRNNTGLPWVLFCFLLRI